GGSGRLDGLRPCSSSSHLALEGAATGCRRERTADRESRSLGLPLRVRRLSVPPDLDRPDRRRASRLDPGVVAGSLRRHQGRAFAADYATFTGAPGRLVDAVPGRRPSRPNRGAFGSVEAYLIGEPSSPGAKPAITSLFPLSFHPAVTCGW